MHDHSRRCLIAAALVALLAGWVNVLWARRAPEVRYTPNFKSVPMQLGERLGRQVKVEERIFEYLGADAMQEIAYEKERQAPVRLSLVYGTDWRAIHSPLSCYPQQGWFVDKKEEIEIEAPPDCPHPGPLQAQVLYVHKAGIGQAALYVFAYRGGTTGNWTTQGLKVSGSPRGTGGMIVSLSMITAPGRQDEALATLKEALLQVYTPAVSFWYTDTK